MHRNTLLLNLLSISALDIKGLDHLAMKLHLEAVDEVLCGLVVRVEDQALVTKAHQLDVLHLKQEAAGGRPALCFGYTRIFAGF